jgi:hypothetical protein
MTIKPIKTERDYHKALKEIEKLWDAKPNTPKGDRLDVLVTLVEAYEQKHYSRPCRSHKISQGAAWAQAIGSGQNCGWSEPRIESSQQEKKTHRRDECGHCITPSHPR